MATKPAKGGSLSKGSPAGPGLCFHKRFYLDVFLFLVGLTGFKEVCGGSLPLSGKAGLCMSPHIVMFCRLHCSLSCGLS